MAYLENAVQCPPTLKERGIRDLLMQCTKAQHATTFFLCTLPSIFSFCLYLQSPLGKLHVMHITCSIHTLCSLSLQGRTGYYIQLLQMLRYGISYALTIATISQPVSSVCSVWNAKPARTSNKLLIRAPQPLPTSQMN